MITAREIVAWRAQADWNSDLMVEQDYLLSQAVQAIFEDPFLRTQVAMRGGTVLHKGHLAPAVRYSSNVLANSNAHTSWSSRTWMVWVWGVRGN